MTARCNLIGFFIATLVPTAVALAHEGDCNNNGLPDVVDLVGKIYWADGTRIRRANLDGSNVEDLVTSGVESPRGIALDMAAGKMYWTDASARKIQRADLDGANVEDLHTNTTADVPVGIALHAAAGKVYWGNQEHVSRANLDGTFPENISAAGIEVQDIALDLSASHVYFTELFTDKIFRQTLNGAGIAFPVTTGSLNPIGIALDSGAGKIYWTHPGTHKIQRANLDGTAIEDLVTTGLVTPIGIALDILAGKMYWADQGTGKIQRADFNGANVEDLGTFGFSAPPYIAIIPRTDDPDSDGDGVLDDCDDCQNDPAKRVPGICGCGTPDADTDGDGAPDCLDGCPNDPGKLHPGICGCGAADADSDGDGFPDCLDDCPDDPNKLYPGFCGCGTADDPGDSDRDGVINCLDNCPMIANADQADANSNGVGDVCEPAGVSTPPNGNFGCGSGMEGVTIMPMTLLGMGWIRKRTWRRTNRTRRLRAPTRSATGAKPTSTVTRKSTGVMCPGPWRAC